MFLMLFSRQYSSANLLKQRAWPCVLHRNKTLPRLKNPSKFPPSTPLHNLCPAAVWRRGNCPDPLIWSPWENLLPTWQWLPREGRRYLWGLACHVLHYQTAWDIRPAAQQDLTDWTDFLFVDRAKKLGHYSRFQVYRPCLTCACFSV